MVHSPFDDLPQRKPKKKAQRKPKKKAQRKPKKKAQRKSKKAKKEAGKLPLYEKFEKPDADGQCLRSPCRPWEDGGWFMDPKVGRASVQEAMKEVRSGSPMLRRIASVKKVGEEWKVVDGKRQRFDVHGVAYRSYRGPLAVHLPGDGRWPLSVALGLGVDSIAILVGLVQLYRRTRKRHWIPAAITFADTGGEQHSTYALVPKLNRWLKKNGFPPIQIMAYSTASKIGGTGGWGTGITLEASCINKHLMPSISYQGNHSCSLKFKVLAQEPWLKEQIESGVIRIPPKGKLLRAIGFDATEDKRMIKGGTYANDGEKKSGFQAWYPLVEWNWDRSRCIAEIIHEFTGSYEVNKTTIKAVPRKSSCFFCGAMKPFEIAALPKDLLERALFMEQVAIHGRHGLKGGIKGLGSSLRWSDFAVGKIAPKAYAQNAVIYGTVYKKVKKRETGRYVWEVDYYGKPKGKLDPSRQYHSPGTGPLITKAELDKITKKAKAWVKATKGRKKEGTDSACLPEALRIPAYTHILGYRGEAGVTYDRLRDEILPRLEERASRSHRPGTKAEEEREEAEVQLDCLEDLVVRSVKNRRKRRNPQPLPVVPENILLTGGD